MKALVFDLDGTLVDTKHDMLDAGNLVFENQGWTTRLEGFAGLQTAIQGGRAILRYGLQNEGVSFNEELLKDYYQLYLSNYDKVLDNKSSNYDGVLETLEAGSIIVDHTTASVTIAQDVNQRTQEIGIGFIDAPISGGQSGAEQGTLSIMCGGTEDDFEKALPIMGSYGKTMTLIGPSGSGQFTKMVNQILCAGAIQGAAEAIAFGLKAGLDMDNVLDAVKSGAAGSWYLQNRADTMVNDEFDFGFAVDLMHKDLNLVIDQAKLIGSETPLTKIMLNSLEESQHDGDNRMDATVIIRNYLKEEK